MPPVVWRLLLAFSTAGIIYLSLSPAQPSDGLGWDKANHAAAMAVVALLANRAFLRFPRPVALAAGYAFLLGILIELLQGICTTNRTAEWGDLIADVVGIALAVTALIIWNRRKGKNEATG